MGENITHYPIWNIRNAFYAAGAGVSTFLLTLTIKAYESPINENIGVLERLPSLSQKGFICDLATYSLFAEDLSKLINANNIHFFADCYQNTVSGFSFVGASIPAALASLVVYVTLNSVVWADQR